MKNTELAAWINDAAVKYECDLDDKIDEAVAADNFINNIINIFISSGYGIKFEAISSESSDYAGSGVISINNDIFGYTE